MLDTVKTELVSALAAAGIEAVAAYPRGRLDRGAGPLAAVGVKRSELVSSGAGEYLGTRTTAEEGEVELYGFRLDIVFALDIISPRDSGPDGCAACFSEIAAALGALPSGLKLKSLACGETVFDRELGMFRCGAELRFMAYLISEAEAGAGEFRDFTLKGAVR